MDAQILFRGILVGLVARQHDGGRANLLVFGGDAGRNRALFHQGLGGPQQAVARHDDAVVGRDEVLLGAVDDRSHALLDRAVLHAEALNPAIAAARFLGGAVHQIVVVLVGGRPEGAGDAFDVNALAVLHGGD